MSFPPVPDSPAALAAATIKSKPSAENDRQPETPSSAGADNDTAKPADNKSSKRGVRGPRTLRRARAARADENRMAKQGQTEVVAGGIAPADDAPEAEQRFAAAQSERRPQQNDHRNKKKTTNAKRNPAASQGRKGANGQARAKKCHADAAYSFVTSEAFERLASDDESAALSGRSEHGGRRIGRPV